MIRAAPLLASPASDGRPGSHSCTPSAVLAWRTSGSEWRPTSRARLDGWLLSVLLLLPGASACTINLDAETITHTDEHRFSVDARPTVVLSTFDGAIRVEAGTGSEVLVTIRKRAEDLETAKAIDVKVLQDGNRITVDVPQPPRATTIGFNVGRSASLEVRLPAQADVQARTGDGAIDIRGVNGRVEARSGDGAVRCAGLQGDLVVSTGDGAITLEDVTGRVDVHSGDGSISGQGAFERVKAHTGDGSVSLRVGPGSRISEDWEVSTGDGSVTLEVPPGLDGVLDASTGDGRISIDGLTLEEASRGEHHLKGRLGGGGSRIKLRSGDGAVTVRATG